MSVTDFPIVFLFHVPWVGLRHRSHQFAEGLVDRGHRVLYVELPWSYGSALRQDRSRLRRPAARMWEPRPGLIVARPPLIPPFSNESRAMRLFNTSLLRSHLRRVIRREGFEGGACLSLDPAAVRVLDVVEWGVTAFDLADDYATWPGASVAAQPLAAKEMESLARRSDVCFAVSRRLAGGFEQYARRMIYLPNAADTTLFAASAGRPDPPEMRGLPRPIVGFAGVLHEFFDQGLIRDLALARPSWSIVLAGPAETDTTTLHGIANIHLLGGQPYERLPGLVGAFDVAVLPWKNTSAGASANPSKIWQYLAAGRPVVATEMPEVKALPRVAGAVTLASGADAFVAAIERQLAGAHDAGLVAARVARAAEEDWSVRVRDLEGELISVMESKRLSEAGLTVA